MPDPSIDSITFISVPRPIKRAIERVNIMERDGIDGSAWKKQGQRNALSPVTCVIDRDDEAGLSALELLIFAMVGTVVTVVDDFGKSWANMFVVDVVHAEPPKKGGLAVGGTTAGSVLAFFNFTFQDRDLV